MRTQASKGRSDGRSSVDTHADRSPSGDPITEIIASYDHPVIRAYSRIRFSILRQNFLDEIGQYLPRSGRVLDLGCGFGLFSLYFAWLEPERWLVGIDLDRRRIEYARTSAEGLGLHNVEYHVEDVRSWENHERFDAIYLLDIVHHLPRGEVPAFLAKLRAGLRDAGILVVKDVEDRPRWKMWFTLLLDRLMVGRDPVHYWSPSELIPLLEELGFSVVRHRMKDFLPYPHILYVCRLLEA